MMRLWACGLLILILAIPISALAEGTTGGSLEGTLEIRSVNEGARVYIGGQYMGHIQSGVLSIPESAFEMKLPHDLMVAYTGYQTYYGPLPSMVPERTVAVIVQLKEEGYDSCGILALSSIPPGASVFLNDYLMGTTPDSGELFIHTLPSYTYNLSIRMAGYEPSDTRVYVNRNAITPYTIVLSQATTGGLDITSTPSGSDISLDGQMVGITPLTIPNAPIGNHTVTLTEEGYQKNQSSVEVIGGETTSVSISLEPIPSTPVPTCPPAVIEKPSPGTPEPTTPQKPILPPQHLMIIGGLGFILVLMILAIILRKE